MIFVPEINIAASDFITREVFDVHIQKINSRLDADEKVNDMRIRSIEAIIDKNMANINGAINLLSENTVQGFKLMNERINRTNDRISNLEKSVNEKLKHVEHIAQDLNKSTNERITNLEKVIDEKLLGINERISNLEKSVDEKLKHFEYTMNERLNSMDKRINSLEKFFNEKIEHVTDTLTVAINNLDNRITDMKEDMKHEQNKSMAKLGIAIALFVGAVQVAVAVILNFWK